jgi:hypothetical protein
METKVAVFWYVIGYCLVASYGRFVGTLPSVALQKQAIFVTISVTYNLTAVNYGAKDAGRLRCCWTSSF